MAQLPTPGADEGVWGQLLNDFLLESHNPNGTLKNGSVSGNAITDGTISEAKLDGALRSKISAQGSGGTIPWGAVVGTIADQTDLQVALDEKQAAGSYISPEDLSNAISTKADAADLDAKADATAVNAALDTKAGLDDVVTVSGNQSIVGSKNFTGGLQVNGQNAVATNDARLTNTRVPTDNSVTTSKLQDLSVTAQKLSAGTANAGQVLSYNGSGLAWTTSTADGVIPDASTTQKGIVQLAGDLSGTAGEPTVAKINGVTISGVPSSGRILIASSATTAAWQPSPSTGSINAADIEDATIVGISILTAADTSAAREAIGAGVSNLTIGTAATQAKAGNYQPTADQVTETTAKKMLTAAERTKLSGIATAATANSTDAALRARSSHTGTQTAATISDLAEVTRDTTAAFIKAGTNVTVVHDDDENTLTINSSGGGEGSKGDPGDVAPTNGVSSPTVWNSSNSPLVATSFAFPATYHRVLAANYTISSLPNPGTAASGTLTFVIRLSASASSPYTITWPSNVLKDANQDYAMTSTAGYWTIFHLFWTGSKWTLSKQGDYNLSGV